MSDSATMDIELARRRGFITHIALANLLVARRRSSPTQGPSAAIPTANCAESSITRNGREGELPITCSHATEPARMPSVWPRRPQPCAGAGPHNDAYAREQPSA